MGYRVRHISGTKPVKLPDYLQVVQALLVDTLLTAVLPLLACAPT